MNTAVANFLWLYETRPDLVWTSERKDRLFQGDAPLPKLLAAFKPAVTEDPEQHGRTVFLRLHQPDLPENA